MQTEQNGGTIDASKEQRQHSKVYKVFHYNPKSYSPWAYSPGWYSVATNLLLRGKSQLPKIKNWNGSSSSGTDNGETPYKK